MRPTVVELVPLALTAAAAAVDLRWRTVPDGIPVALLGWAILAGACGWTHLSAAAWFGGLALGVAAGLLLFFGGGFGGGDAKLLMALGPALGARAFLVALAATAVAGGVLALVAKARGRRDLAYAPAIAAGVLVSVFSQVRDWL